MPVRIPFAAALAMALAVYVGGCLEHMEIHQESSGRGKEQTLNTSDNKTDTKESTCEEACALTPAMSHAATEKAIFALG